MNTSTGIMISARGAKHDGNFFARLFDYDPNEPNSKPQFQGETEVQRGPNPIFTKIFPMIHEFGTPKKFFIHLLEKTAEGLILQVGHALFDADSLVGSHGNKVAKSIDDGVHIIAELTGSTEPFNRDIPVVSSHRVPTMFDYINGGCEISLCVAIDFTGSNGDPREPGTLHHFNHDGSKNDYEKAIVAVGNILAHYDSDKKFPVWGFGAKISGQLHNCFQVGTKAEVDGVAGIIKAYHQVFATGIIMSGPTDITEVIEAAAKLAVSGQEAAKKVGKQKYTILLILTDGGVSDIPHTVDTLKKVCTCPLSVVIIGIGNGDFTSMKFLDELKPTDVKHDICEFVQYNSYVHDTNGLTKATLHEIPAHLVGYFTRNGIQPNPTVAVADREIVVLPHEQEIDLSHDFFYVGKE